MNLLLYILLLIPIFCSSQRSGTNPISENFLENKSLLIKIEYKKQGGCVEKIIGKIRIKVHDGNVFFSHFNYSMLTGKTNTESFKFQDKGVINLVSEMEITSIDLPMCGGIDGGSTFVTLDINSQKNEFGYCFSAGNGLDEMINEIRKYKKTIMLTLYIK